MGYAVNGVVVGTALESFGFTANDTISGLGLNTFGFLWGCSDIWTNNDDPTLTTTWTSCEDLQNLDECQVY